MAGGGFHHTVTTKDEHLYRHWAHDVRFDNTTPGAIAADITANNVQEAIEEIALEAGSTISDEPFGPPWDGVTSIGASKNALYDIISSLQRSENRAYNVFPIESPNGIRVQFTIPGGNKYVSGTLIVYTNGLREYDITEISDTVFEYCIPAPLIGDIITIDYTLK